MRFKIGCLEMKEKPLYFHRRPYWTMFKSIQEWRLRYEIKIASRRGAAYQFLKFFRFRTILIV